MRLRKSLVLLVLGLAISVALGNVLEELPPIDDEPCTPNATVETRETLKLLCGFTSDPTAGILSGQNTGHAGENLQVTFRHSWIKLHAFRELPQPSVMAVDLGDGRFPRDFRFMNQLLVEHAEAGGLVSVSMHPPNPWTGGDSKDLSEVDFSELMREGSKARRNWRNSLDQAASALEGLKHKNVVVLWRPLHEANGDWFWWCCGNGKARIKPGEYKLLWQDMFRYFTEERQLDNLLWVFSPNVKAYRDITPVDDAYPGGEFVDVFGLDYYGKNTRDLNRRGCYRKALRTGKPIALTEFGSEPMNGSLKAAVWIDEIKRDFPRLAYFVFWHSWPRHEVAMADLTEADEILNDDFVLNLEELRIKKRTTNTEATAP